MPPIYRPKSVGFYNPSTGALIDPTDPAATIRSPGQWISGGTITRSADTTTYATRDFIGHATDGDACTLANSVFQFDMSAIANNKGRISRMKIVKSTNGVTGIGFVLTLFKAAAPAITPGAGNGDNAASSVALTLGATAVPLGDLSMTSNLTLVDGLVGFGEPLSQKDGGISFNLSADISKTLYGILTAGGNYAPGSAETFTVSIEVV